MVDSHYPPSTLYQFVIRLSLYKVEIAYLTIKYMR